jgi:hypothetical protein
MAPDFDVSWPVDRSAGEYNAMIFDALASIEALSRPGATLEAAFEAGRATERVARYQEQILTAKMSAPRTDHFYAIAVNLVRGGVSQTLAYTRAKIWCTRNLRRAVIPTRAAFKTYLARLRGNTGVLP